MALVVAGCLALGLTSLLARSAPSADAWAWIVWGRELVHLDLDTTNGSSWKPLPVLITAPLSLAGGAAPDLWLAVARAGGVLALVMAYRLATRAGGRAAGAVAVAAILSADWFRFVAAGESEPLLAGLILWAVERHLDGQRGHALVLGFVCALGRPEVWPFFGVYLLWICLRDPSRRRLAVVFGAAVPVAWFGGDWWGAGDPFYGGKQANTRTPSSLNDSAHPALALLERATHLVAAPILAAAAAGVVYAAVRFERIVLALGAGAAGWVAIVAVMTQLGYTGNERYLFPVTCVAGVLAGAGVVAIVRSVRDRTGVLAGTRGAALAVAAFVALSAPFAVSRARAIERQAHKAHERAEARSALDRLVARLGGRAGIERCGRVGVTRGGFQGALAWRLHLSPGNVSRPDPPDKPLLVAKPAVIFDASGSKAGATNTGRAADTSSWRGPGLTDRPIASAGPWRAIAVTRTGRHIPAGCGVGSG
jgi:hypothetical protein